MLPTYFGWYWEDVQDIRDEQGGRSLHCGGGRQQHLCKLQCDAQPTARSLGDLLGRKGKSGCPKVQCIGEWNVLLMKIRMMIRMTIVWVFLIMINGKQELPCERLFSNWSSTDSQSGPCPGLQEGYLLLLAPQYGADRRGACRDLHTHPIHL